MSDQSGQDIFDQTMPDQVPETPHLEDVLRLAMRACAMGLRVAMPCSVATVRGNQLVDVQPLLQAQYVMQAGPTTLPIIPNVLVSMPMGQDYSVKLPLAVGDTGLAIFTDRSLDNWAASQGGVVDPQDGRTHDLMDAVFIPGLVPTAKQTTDTTQDLVISNGQAQIRLEKTGRFKVANGQNETLDLLDQLMASYLQLLSDLAQAVILTPVGPAGFASFTQQSLASLTVTANTIRANLDTLKG